MNEADVRPAAANHKNIMAGTVTEGFRESEAVACGDLRVIAHAKVESGNDGPIFSVCNEVRKADGPRELTLRFPRPIKGIKFESFGEEWLDPVRTTIGLVWKDSKKRVCEEDLIALTKVVDVFRRRVDSVTRETELFPDHAPSYLDF